MLGGEDVFKLYEGIFSVSVHGQDKFMFDVVPVVVDANVLFSIKIKFSGLAFTDGNNEEISILLFGVFDIDNKGEGDIMGLMEEES